MNILSQEITCCIVKSDLNKKMRILIIDEDEKYTKYTKNIIYNKVFNKFLQRNYF